MQFFPVNNHLDMLSSRSQNIEFGGKSSSKFAGFADHMREASGNAREVLETARSGLNRLSQGWERSMSYRDRYGSSADTREAIDTARVEVQRVSENWEGSVSEENMETGYKDNNKNNTDNSFLEEKVSEEDFAALKEELQEQGISKEKIEDLEEQVDDGELTWGGLFSKLEEAAGKGLQVDLKAGDKERIQSLLQKLGFSPDKAQKMLQDLLAGNLDEVFSKIKEKLQDLSLDKLIDFSKKDFQALARVFGLKEAGFEFPYGEDAKLNKKQLEHILTSLKQQAAEAKDSRLQKSLQKLQDGEISPQKLLDKLTNAKSKNENSAVASALKQAIQAKKDGKEFDSAADKERYYKVMANKEKSEKSGSATKEGEKKGSPSKSDHSGKNAQGQNAHKMTEQDKFLQKEGEGKVKHNSTEKTSQSDQKFASKTGKDQDARSGNQQKDSEENAKSWKELLNKLNSSNENSGKEANSRQSFLQNNNFRDIVGSKEIKNPATGQRVSTSRIMDQIQQGMFKNLGQGRSQMTLQLNPPNLGMVSVKLQMQNNEVHAMIRTSNQEVNHVVQDNMAQLKSSLEQQGLRVNKLDVQTQLQDDSHLQDSQWQGMDDHNQARERLRQTGRMGKLRHVGEEGEELVQEMQVVEYGENISESGLDMFA